MKYSHYLLLFVWSLSLNAQNQLDTLQAKQYLQIADSLRNIKENALALEYYPKAIAIFKLANQWENYLEAAINESICLRKTGQMEEVLNQLNELLEIVKTRNLHKTLIEANIYHQLGVYYYYQNDYEKAIEEYQNALEIRKLKLGNNNTIVLRGYYNIAAAYEYLGDVNNGVINIKLALEVAKKLMDSEWQIKCYQKLGDLSHIKGDYEQAIKYYNQIVPLNEQIYGEESVPVAELYTLLGLTYFANADLNKSLIYHQLSNDIYSKGKTQKDKIGVANCYNNFGNVYYEKEEYKDALKNYKKALEVNLKYQINNIQIVAKNYSNLGLTYLELEDFENAIFNLKKALNISLGLFPEFHNGNLNAYYNLGFGYLKARDYHNALFYFQKALFTVFTDFREKDYFNNPDLISGQIKGDYRLINPLIKGKAKALYQLAQSQNNNLPLLQLSLSTSNLAMDVIDLMRQDHTAEGSKLFWTEETLAVYENAIQTAYELYNLTKENNYLVEAFNIAEKSKSVVLLGAMRDSEAKQFAGIPESLLEKEKELKKSLSEKEEALFQEKQNENVDSSSLKKLQTAVFESTLAYNDLIDQLEKDHPDYHRMKYDMGNASLEEVQSWLQPNQAMLSYFVGDSASYVFKVLKNDLELVVLDEEYPLEKRVTDLRESLYGYHLDPNRSDELFMQMAATYVQVAHDLHRRLIAPLGDLPEHLIIIPAGLLGYIPFEVLLSEEPSKVMDFVNHPYLLRQHTISYSYSATLLREMLERQHQPKYRKLLAYAPAFEASETRYSDIVAMRSDLTPLLHNIPESENIKSVLGGKLVTGNDASMENFLAQAANYSILHCATHGKADDVNSNFSYLAFSNADSIDHLLYVQDLYNLQLNADMVTLSACETGIGKLYRGEGIASIARGFSYAGAKSMITTLWAVNDQRMAEIMGSFYENLAEGQEKDVALRNAKLTYLEDQKQQFAHPFYWAATIPIGDMGVIEVDETNWWLWGIFGIGLLGILILLKTRKSSNVLK